MDKKKNKNKNKLSSDKSFNKTLGWIVAAGCVLMIALGVLMALYRGGAFDPGKKPEATPEPTAAPQMNFVLPEVRTGRETRPAPIALKGMSLENAVQKSDAVLLVRVGDWLAETDEQTLYECTVLEALKGDVGEKFVLVQDGCSKSTLPDYPLFKGGNELLVFLTPSDLENDAIPQGEKAYELTGSYTTLFYSIALSKDGRFAVSRCENWYRRMPREIPNLGDVTYYRGSVYSSLAEWDYVWNNYNPEYRMIYSYDKLAEAIRGLL